MDSDRQGRFFGALPRSGEWKLDLERHSGRGLQHVGSVVVEIMPGEQFATLLVELPPYTLWGRVVDRNGDPVPQALIEVLNAEERRIEASTWSDLDGRFELQGLEPGTYFVEAEVSGSRSPPQEIDLAGEEPEADVTLTVSPMIRIAGTVVSGGAPVPGARIVGFPELPSGGPAPVLTATTGMDGGFELEAPAGASRVLWLAQAPGGPLKLDVTRGQAGNVLLDIPPVGGVLTVRIPAASPRHSLVLSQGAMSLNLQWLEILGMGVQETIDGEGKLVFLPGVAPGVYTVCLADPGSDAPETPTLPRCGSSDLPPERESWIDFSDHQGGL